MKSVALVVGVVLTVVSIVSVGISFSRGNIFSGVACAFAVAEGILIVVNNSRRKISD